MLRNYVVVALRLLVKNKVFSLINILGLSTGIACCILITLYIQDEFNYEKGIGQREKIFRINTAFVKDGVTEYSPYTSPAIAFGLQQELPGIEQATRVVKFLGVDQHIVRYRDKTFFEKRACLVDSTFLDVFPLHLEEGNAATALDAPRSALISKQLSERIFGTQSPLDELLMINSGQSVDTFRITGVVATPRFPSHIDSDLYLSMNSNGLGGWVLGQTTWANNNLVGSYLKLQDPENYKALESKFAKQLDLHAGEELRASGRHKDLSLQSLNDIRLYSNFSKSFGADQGSSITYVYIIATIGGFILLLACINFMNLTTAKSAQRAGEVGIRKSMGAFRGNLVRQFLGESMVIVFFAMLVALLTVMLVLPIFNSVMQKELSLNGNNLWFIIIATALICLFTAVLAGSYPAFFLSSLRPTQVLKGKSVTSGAQWLRKGLVVFQFVITITLISSIVIIQQQLRYIQSKSLGFDTEQVVMVPLRTPSALQAYSTLKTEFERIGGVKVVSGSSSIPSTPLFTDWGLYKQGSSNDQSLQHEIVWVDGGYFNTLDIQLVAGRDFNSDQDNLPNDDKPLKVIVNEASLKALGIPLSEALSTPLYFQPGSERYQYEIIGVAKDFHQFSLHRPIGPMALILPPGRNRFNYMALSLKLDQYAAIQSKMKAAWDQRINDIPFESVFLNENVKKLYNEEARTSTMLTISTVIALIISCLGLYGLSIYVAERKTKEIGIRKVVGASVTSIVGMLSKEYIILIIVSFVIAIPAGYFMMDKWLQSFAYKISPGVTVFLVSGAVAFSIAWLTISFESLRAARRNPVDTLRTQ